MYKLDVTQGQGPSRKVNTKEYFMTQVGMHQAEEEFEMLTHQPDVMDLRLWRQDIHGTFELKRWERNG